MKAFWKVIIMILVALLNAGLMFGIFTLFSLGNYAFAIFIALFLFITDWAIFSEKAYPYRYTIPALFFLFILTIYPIYYTVATAFTNYGTGHLFTRDQSIDTLVTDPTYFYEPENGKALDFMVFVKYDDKFQPTEDFLILTKDDGGKLYLSEKPTIMKYDAKGNLLNAESLMLPVTGDSVSAQSTTYKLLKAVSKTDISTQSPTSDATVSEEEDSFGSLYGTSEPEQQETVSESSPTIITTTTPVSTETTAEASNDDSMDLFASTESQEASEVIASSGSTGEKIIAIEDNNGNKYTYFFSPDDTTVSANSAFYNSVLRNKYIKSLELSLGNMKFRLANRFIFGKFAESYKKYDVSVKVDTSGPVKVYKTVIINQLTNRELVEKDSTFFDYSEDGKLQSLVGYSDYIGTFNFDRIIKDPKITGPFFQIFGWTFTYAALSVLFSFIIGLTLAIALNDKGLKGRMIYRTLLIIPWAVPAFISVLVWKNGFFNETYGVINRFIVSPLGLEPLKWMNDPFLAKVAILIVNTWLGFPYMMTVVLGSLQSIPEEYYEAASIDGATRWKQFKSITMPLLMVSVAPLLVMSFSFNFNNFVNIYLLTEGRPAIPNTNTPAGATDILISYTYKLAFEGSNGQDFGFASAISILIFIIISGISVFNFKFTKAFEEVSR